jgi:hypothetical protein
VGIKMHPFHVRLPWQGTKHTEAVNNKKTGNNVLSSRGNSNMQICQRQNIREISRNSVKRREKKGCADRNANNLGLMSEIRLIELMNMNQIHQHHATIIKKCLGETQKSLKPKQGNRTRFKSSQVH